MKGQWFKRILEILPPGVSLTLFGLVSIDPGSVAQHLVNEDGTNRDEIIGELKDLKSNSVSWFDELKTILEIHGIDTQEKFDKLISILSGIYENNIESLPDYDDYLKFVIKDLSEWQTRYAPMFAKFKTLTLFARVASQENNLPSQELIELIHKNNSLVILGSAGSGKTTTLKKVALDHAFNFIQQKPDNYIPIIIPLRDYGGVSLKELIDSILKPWKIELKKIEQDLRKGKFLIIFDGLNEVPPQFRTQCFQEIRNFSREYRFNRFLYTSRSFEYKDEWISTNNENPILACEIDALTKEQIEDCIYRYFDEEKELAVQLIYQLKIHDSIVWANNKSLARLASTPLLLQMLILTFREKRRIPKNESELLFGFVNEILLKIEPGKSAAVINPDIKKALLATIAWTMHQDSLSSIDKRRAFSMFLKRLEELKQTGIAAITSDSNQIWQELQNNHLIIDTNDLVYWPHPLYQELFVGLSLREKCFEDDWTPKFTEIYMQFRSIEAKWYGNSSFEAGLRMLEVTPHPHRLNGLSLIAMINPSLAKEAFARFEPEHNPGLMDEFSTIVKKDLLSDKWRGENHRNLLMCINHISDSNFCSLFSDSAILCSSWEGRCQAAAFLWSHCDKLLALEILKNMCANDPDAQARKTAFNILINSAALVDESIYSFLTQRVFDENQSFLLDPQLHLTKLLDSVFVVRMLVDSAKKETNLTKKNRAVWCLGKSQIHDLEAQKILINLTRKSNDDEVRIEAVDALAAYSSNSTVKTLNNLIKNDSSKLVRINAVNSLRSIGNVKTISSIISALSDNEDSVIETAISALIDWNEKERQIVNQLLQTLRDNNLPSKILLTLSRIALKTVDPKIKATICKELRYHRNEQDKYVRLQIALALRVYDPSLSNDILRELSNDKDKMIRENAQEIINDWNIEM